MNFNPALTSEHYLIKNRLLRAILQHRHYIGGKLLDFGCGSRPYQSVTWCQEYIGLDFKGRGHDHDREKIDLYYDGRTIPFPDETFDSILTTEVFEHIFNLPAVLQEIYRVLKPGGTILLTCPFAFPEHEIPADFARYTSYGIRSLLEETGFRVIVQQKTGNGMEAIATLIQCYLQTYISPVVRKIPFFGWILTRCYTWFVNVTAIALGAILPSGDDLYLSNVLICKKNALSQ